MLHIARLNRAAADYYLADLALELGPPGRGGPGRWTGAGAAGLGLAGPVGGDDLRAVLAARVPATGRPLTPRPGAVAAYDLTFAAPKSVSVLMALGGPATAEAVVAAHRGAVDGALAYVEHHALAVRRGTGEERVVLAPGGMTGATFTHGVSRALDPHLHTHAVVANLAHGPDSRWSALDARGLFAHGAAAAAVYGAHLRHALTTSLGVDWEERSPGGWQVAGLDPGVLAGFSQRSGEISQHLAERGLRSAAERVAWAATRDPKRPGLGAAEVAGRWARTAGALGVDRHEVEAAVGRAAAPEHQIDEARFAAALVVSPHATATRRDVVRAWSGALRHGTPAASTERGIDAWLPPPAPGRSPLAAVGVAEPVHALAGIVVPGHLVRALGGRPVAAAGQAVWREAARDVERYRARWGITERRHALGTDGSPGSMARLPARQLADYLGASRRLAQAQRALGRVSDRELSIDRGLGRG